MKKIVSLILTAVIFGGMTARATITLPSVISDNMVLQQQTDAALWGVADCGKKVSVSTSWDNASYSAKADAKTGKWIVRVKTPAAGGPYTITISDGTPVTLKNVLIGEVWFCSGQSNMEMPVKGYGSQPARGGMEAIVNAKPSRQIRMCNIARQSSTQLMDATSGSWLEHTPENVGNTSATAYFFADAVEKAIDVPVGIIVSCWGGSSIETWLNRETIETLFPEFSLGHLDGTEKIKRDNQDPCLLFNGQVSPIVPYSFKGMLWYQGETNRGRAQQYIRLQTEYVKMMRNLFNEPLAPFYFVQIAPYPYDNPDSFASGYFCEAQAKTLETIPYSGMAVTCDIGEFGTIHPCRKQEVGQRLAYLALAHDYGFSAITADAPSYKDVEFKDGRAYVTFNTDKLGLSPMGVDLPGFEIAGEDKVFKPAKARFSKGNQVVVSSEDVPSPVAVRYCFRNMCTGGLYNNFGIPAAPFRTDDWDL